MDKEIVKKKVGEFLRKNELAIVSTIHANKNAPESAIVGFGQTENLEVFFGTSIHARKYKNLQKNQNVSLIIGWSSKTGSLQYEGIAQELTQEETEKYSHLLIKKNEDHKNFLSKEDQRYYLVKPIWIRFYDNAGDLPDVYELNF